MSACAALFVVLAARYVYLRDGAPGLFSLHTFYNPGTFSMQPLLAGAAIASLSYIGFDAISTLAEDTIRPERDISIATVLVCVIQTAFCVSTVYLAALVWPDYHSYPEAETVILDVGRSSRRCLDDGLHHLHLAGRRPGQRLDGPGRSIATSARHGTRRRHLAQHLRHGRCSLLHSHPRAST